jgi:hypothetical protein
MKDAVLLFGAEILILGKMRNGSNQAKAHLISTYAATWEL